MDRIKATHFINRGNQFSSSELVTLIDSYLGEYGPEIIYAREDGSLGHDNYKEFRVRDQ